jgi:ABC-type dipeptide/oligopeptide/nickel transport system permease subunit
MNAVDDIKATKKTLTVDAERTGRVKFTLYRAFWQTVTSSKISTLCLAFIVVIVLVAIFAPYIAPHGPLDINIFKPSQPISWEYPFGSDKLGRCTLSRIIFGARATLAAGIIAVSIGASLGMVLGLLAGYCSRWVDTGIMLVVDLLLAFPYFLLAVLIVAALGASLQSAMIATGIWTFPFYTRLVRATTLSVKERPFIEAARMSGESHVSIIFRYILPNCLSVVIVLSTTYFAQAILMASGLSFLGLGAQPPNPEWGAMTAIGREYMLSDPLALFIPSAFILFTALSFNLIGDTLRDVLDPRLRGMM